MAMELWASTRGGAECERTWGHMKIIDRDELEAIVASAVHEMEEDDPVACFLKWGESKPERYRSDDEFGDREDLEWRLPKLNGVELDMSMEARAAVRWNPLFKRKNLHP